MTEQVTETIEKYHMISEGDHVIVGVSGGADSVCLLALLREYRQNCWFSLSVVHVEHGIRGADSLSDAAFVEELCREWNLPCFVEHVDVRRRAAREGLTLEEAGRQARYEIFETYRSRLGANRIAVAHNQNDQAETVLLNLARGSGLKGLGGIRPVRGRIIRPLLFASREEIEGWLGEQGLSYCTDLTNLEPDYTRNVLRLEILPRLEAEVNRETIRHMAQGALHLQKAEEYVRRQAGKVYGDCVSGAGARNSQNKCGQNRCNQGEIGAERTWIRRISLKPFLAAEELMQEYVLRMCVEELLCHRGLKDYTAAHIEQLKRLSVMDCGKRMDFPGGLKAVRQREELVIYVEEKPGKNSEAEGNSPSVCVPIPEDGVYEVNNYKFCVEYQYGTENQVIPEKTYTKWLAYDTIKGKVCLRTRQTGDYLIINREGGKKKLKDYLIDQKIPREERDQVLLVAEGSHILWVVGWRISEDAKVTGDTEKRLKIQMMMEEGI